MKFSRGSGSSGRHAADDARRSGRHSRDGGESATGHDDAAAARRARADHDAPAGVARVDLGSLQIPSVDGVEVRVQANDDGVIQQVVLANGASALQLVVFAAPRTEGIWDETREEIRKSLLTGGVTLDEVAGVYGTELRGRVRNPEGLIDIRFVGVDGPRWMLRAVYQGVAAADPAAAGPLDDCLRGLVVNRGRDAMPVGEALPLRLPREIAEAAKANAAAAAAENAAHQAAPNGSINGANGTAPTNGHHTSGNGAAHPATSDGEFGADDSHRPSPRPRRSE